MKKIILLASFITLSITSATSQVQIALGLKGGINLASINTSGNITSNYESRTGYHLGAYGLFKFTKLAIQPEILFTQQGTTGTFNSQDLEANYNYTTIPIVLKLYLVAGLNLQAGVQFGFLGKSTGDIYNTATDTITEDVELASFMKETDFSVPVGVGWDLPFGLNITARYNIGISDVNEKTGLVNPAVVSALGTSAAKNQVFQVSVGWRLIKLGN